MIKARSTQTDPMLTNIPAINVNKEVPDTTASTDHGDDDLLQPADTTRSTILYRVLDVLGLNTDLVDTCKKAGLLFSPLASLTTLDRRARSTLLAIVKNVVQSLTYVVFQGACMCITVTRDTQSFPTIAY